MVKIYNRGFRVVPNPLKSTVIFCNNGVYY